MTDLILCSDIHFREDQPQCRLDDFFKAQFKAFFYVRELQKENDAVVLHGGDLFHKWKNSPYLLTHVINKMPDNFYTIYGQHDLPSHNYNLADKSSIATLEAAGKVKVLPGTHWGQEVTSSFTYKGRNILVMHRFIWDGKNQPWPGCDELTAEQALDTFTEYDLILTGDNHQPFTYEKDGRLLVNPGCLTRQTAAFKKHKPRVYLYDAKKNTVKPYYIPVSEEVITREHIEVKENRDERMEAFISKLDTEFESEINVDSIFDKFFKQNKVDKEVEQITLKAIGS